MPPMSGVESDMYVDVEIAFESGPSDGLRPRINLLMDPELWRHVMLKKDLNPETLR